MKDVLQAYREAEHGLPEKILTWHLYGAGMENFGKDRKPIELPMPKYGADELLVRVDAVGVCFSDIKVINLGSQHPRITGRDMVNDPVTLGHEPSVTVVGVGESLKDRFKVGERYIVQADVFYQGTSMAFGYVLAGAQTQYQVITKELLNGDEGCYLIPLGEFTGYAEGAMTEAWACVVASYRITRRPSIKPGGALWIIGTLADADEDDSLDLAGDPKVVVATGLKWPMLDQLQFWAAAGRFELKKTQPFESLDLEAKLEKYGGFDDIIVLGADADVIEKSAALLARNGMMNIIADKPLGRPVKIDVGKVHYQNHSYVGTTSRHIRKAYEPIRVPSELRAGGVAWFIGGAGPMGKMHVQRAVEMENSPARILITDVDNARLESAKGQFGPEAERKGIELHVLNPTEIGKEEFDRLANEITGGKGFDDIVVMAPVAAIIADSVNYLAEEGLMNIFAGVPIGTIADLDLTGVYAANIRFVGSSGSRLSDMRDTLNAAESGRLSTSTAVAAVGGIDASWDAMLAVKEMKFTGKVVIYPQIKLGLTALPDLKEKLPNVYAKLTDGMFWNREAEDELLRTLLKA
jgi:threonine dehydrogenase-like Zn-dependent dehydrogenase